MNRKDHPIPLSALDGKVGIMGLTGSGKTFTAIGLVEILLDNGRQVIVVDPTGVYNGLRTEFPLPIFGGKYGDVAIGEESGEAVAKAIIDHDLSAIVDVSLLLKQSHAAARRFMASFVAALKNAETRARYLVMDEADEFMPENANGDVARLFGDLKWIVRRGRSEGWRMLMVTQRPQDIAKSVLTQCETMVIHRLTAPQDRKALLEWVKGNADADQAKDVLESMARLGTGEAWVWSPAHNLLDRVTMPLNRSADRSKTPDADDEPRAALGFKQVDLEAIRSALATPAAATTSIVAPAVPTDHMQCQARITALEAEKVALSKMVNQLTRDAEAMRKGIKQVHEAAVALIQQMKPVSSPEQAAPLAPTLRTKPEGAKAENGGGVLRSGTLAARPVETMEKASPAALAMADLLDRVNPAKLSWTQAATMTGRKASGGNFNAARKWLRASGRIVEDGELVWSSADAPAGMTRAEAIALWKSVLTNPAPRMIDALNGFTMTKEALATTLGVQPRGGNWNNGVSQLRRNGLLNPDNSLGGMSLANPLPGQSA